jgi:non-heme chloroperoxidase
LFIESRTLTKQENHSMNHVTTADKTKLYVKEWGAGRPVILLSGWPLSSDSWDDQAMAIAEAGYRTIAYDRRGFGRSSQPWSGYDYDTLADDLAAVIEQTGAQDAVVAGFSMGGGEVARYMSRHGGKGVSKAILIASVVPYMLKTGDNPEGTDKSVFDEMTKGMKQDRAKFFAGFFKDFYGIGLLSHDTSGEVLEWARSMAMQASLKATLECVRRPTSGRIWQPSRCRRSSFMVLTTRQCRLTLQAEQPLSALPTQR